MSKRESVEVERTDGEYTTDTEQRKQIIKDEMEPEDADQK